MNKTEKLAYEIATPVADDFSIEIYDIEYIKEGSDMVLRIYIDKEGGANINDCENFSRAFSDILDKGNLIDGKFMLEVSTPGIERRLSQPKHFEKYTGCEVTVRLFSAEHGAKQHIGILEEYEPDIVLSVDGNRIAFSKKNISTVNLYYKF